jgi:hypothetical protein
LFNALGGKIIKSLYSSTGHELKGHHRFPENLAKKYDDFMTPEAIDVASRDRIGQGYVSLGIDGDPHRGYSGAHIAHDTAIDSHMDKWISNGTISKDNPMNIKQYYEFMGEVGKIPTVGNFWKSINDWADLQLQMGRLPRLRGMPRRFGPSE